MKEIIKKKVRTVQAKNPAEFDRLFNETSDSMPSTAELVWDGNMCVHFLYDETVQIPQTVREEFEVAGDIHFCKECHYLEDDGDKRKKRFRCKYAEHLLTCKDSPACDVYYRELMNGEGTR